VRGARRVAAAALLLAVASALAAALATGSGGRARALVTLQVAPRGPGSVSTSTGGGVDLDNGNAAISGPCEQNEGEAACHWAFERGTSVTLTAHSTGAGFTSWSTPDCPGTGSCTVSLDDDLTSVVALFDPLTLGVRLSPSADGTVTSDPAGIDCSSDGDDGCEHGFTPNTPVELTVSGGDFKGWNGPCAPANVRTCTIVVDDEKTWAGARFGSDDPPQLATTIDVRFQLRKTGDGGGTVTAANIDCGSQCSSQVGYGKTLTLTAAADASSTFEGWGGVCPPSRLTCTLAVGPITRVKVGFGRDSTPPSPPPELKVTDTSRTSVAIAWGASSDNLGVTGYRVYRDDTQVGDVGTTQFTVADLACGSTYTIAVDASDAAGNRSGKSSLAAATSPCELAARLARVTVRHVRATRTVAVSLSVNRATTVRLAIRKGRRTFASRLFRVHPGANLLRLRVRSGAAPGRVQLRVVVRDPDGAAARVFSRRIRLP